MSEQTEVIDGVRGLFVDADEMPEVVMVNGERFLPPKPDAPTSTTEPGSERERLADGIHDIVVQAMGEWESRLEQDGEPTTKDARRTAEAATESILALLRSGERDHRDCVWHHRWLEMVNRFGKVTLTHDSQTAREMAAAALHDMTQVEKDFPLARAQEDGADGSM